MRLYPGCGSIRRLEGGNDRPMKTARQPALVRGKQTTLAEGTHDTNHDCAG